MDHAEERELEKGLKIRLVAPVYFCASKLEAFAGRGKNDFHASRDLEDLIAVVDGRAELAGEIRGAAGDVRSYLAKEIKKLTSSREFNDALPGHLPPDAGSQDRVGTIISRLEEIASLKPRPFYSEVAPGMKTSSRHSRQSLGCFPTFWLAVIKT